MADITALLNAAAQGEARSQEELLREIYSELRGLAGASMRHERAGHTLQPTALVHEAYLRLLGKSGIAWDSRAHFFVAAARTMRRILIDHARAHQASKRGGGQTRVDLDAAMIAVEDGASDLLAIDTALEKLAALDERQARVVELRFFSGLSVEEAAEVMGVSESTVKRDWTLARAFLEREIRG